MIFESQSGLRIGTVDVFREMMRCTIISEQDLLALRKPVSAALHRALSHYLGSPLHLQLLSSENRYSHNA